MAVDSTWRDHTVAVIESLRENYVATAPIDTTELAGTIDATERTITNRRHESKRIPIVFEALSEQYDQFQHDMFRTEFSPPEELEAHWGSIRAVLTLGGAVIRDVEAWNDSVKTDDALRAIDRATEAIGSNPRNVPWYGHRSLRLAATRAELLAAANRFLGVVADTNFAHPSDSFQSIRLAVFRALQNGKYGRFERIRSTVHTERTRAWTREDLDRFDSSKQEFEQLIALLWSTKGYDTTVTTKSGDGGFDIVAERDGSRVLIEAKHWNDAVDGGTVNSVAGLLPQYDADDVVLVTSSGFTGPALNRAHRADLTLVSGVELCERLTASQLAPPLPDLSSTANSS